MNIAEIETGKDTHPNAVEFEEVFSQLPEAPSRASYYHDPHSNPKRLACLAAYAYLELEKPKPERSLHSQQIAFAKEYMENPQKAAEKFIELIERHRELRNKSCGFSR